MNSTVRSSSVLLTGSSGADNLVSYYEPKTGKYSNGQTYTYDSTAYYVTIKAGDGDDVVKNYSYYSKIYGEGGGDNITNYGSSSTIDGGSGNDNIYNSGSSVTLIGGTGNDNISAGGLYHNTIYYTSGDGDDVITGYADNDTIRLGNGVALSGVDPNGANFKMNLGSGSMTFNSSSYTFIHVADATNIVFSFVYNGTNTIEAVHNFTSSKTLNDTLNHGFLYNSGSKAKVESTSLSDYIYNEGSNATINSGKGNDTIRNYTSYNLIQYANGDGDDSINYNGYGSYYGAGLIDLLDGAAVTNYDYNGYNNNVLTIGTGKVTFNNAYTVTTRETDSEDPYKTGGYVYTRYWNGIKYNSLIYYQGGTYDNSHMSDDYISSNEVNASSDADYIYLGFGQNKTINSSSGDDYIYNYNAYHSFINSGSGKDTIYNQSNSYDMEIDAGSDNDIVYNYAKEVSIIGGDGDDTIYTNANKGLVEGGFGDDKITLSGSQGNNIIKYTPGEGNDTIWGYKEGDMVFVTDDEVPNVLESASDNNLYLKFSNEQIITLIDAKNKKVTVGDPAEPPNPDNLIEVTLSSDNTNLALPGSKKSRIASTNIVDISTVIAGSSVGSILGVDPDGTVSSNRKKTIKIKGNDYANYITGTPSKDSIDGGAGKDTLFGGTGADTLSGGTGKDTFLVRVYEPGKAIWGVKDANVNTNVIADYNPEEDVIKVLGNGVINASVVKKKKDIVFTVKNTNSTRGKASINVKGGYLQKITLVDPKGNRFSQVYGAKKIEVANGDGDTINTLINTSVMTIDGSQRTTDVCYVGNVKNNLIISGTGDNTIVTGKGKDTLVYMGGNDVITDYTAGKDVIKIDSSEITNVYYEGNDLIFTAAKQSETTVIPTEESFSASSSSSSSGNIEDENIVTTQLKILNAINKNGKKQKITMIDNSGKKSTIVYGESTVKATNADGNIVDASKAYNANILTVNAAKRTKAIEIIGNENNNTLKGGKKADTIYGGFGYDLIYGGAGNDILDGETGVDTIIGGVGNDTMYADGSDTFVYSIGDGNDLIVGLSETDTIQLGSKKTVINEAKTKISGDDVILQIGKGSIRIDKGKNKNITIVDFAGSRTSKIYNGVDDNKTFKFIQTSDTTSTITKKADAQIITLDASELSNPVDLTGNAKDNVLKSSKGGGTLKGGLGNDKLYGGTGNDTFVYTLGDGNDLIVNFSANDVIKLATLKTKVNDKKSYVSGDDYVLTVGKNTIKVQGAAKQEITVVDYSGNKISYNKQVTSSTTTVASPFIEKAWFETDDNFANNEMDSIIQNDTSTNVVTTDNMNLHDSQLIVQQTPILNLASNKDK